MPFPAIRMTKTDADVQSSGKDLFINLSVNRREVYLGEPIVATVKLYSRVNIAGINEIKYPDFNSFLKSDIDTPPLTSLRQENVNGTIYGSGVVQQFLLYPQVTGEINIDPVQISVLIQKKIRGNRLIRSSVISSLHIKQYQQLQQAKQLKLRSSLCPAFNRLIIQELLENSISKLR